MCASIYMCVCMCARAHVCWCVGAYVHMCGCAYACVRALYVFVYWRVCGRISGSGCVWQLFYVIQGYTVLM